MRNRWICMVSAALFALPLAAQAPALHRTPDGHPDLQGTYDLSMMTPLERLPGDPPFLTKEKAEALQKAEAARRAKNNQPLPADSPAPPVGGTRPRRNPFLKFWRGPEAATSAATIISGCTRARNSP